MFGKKKSLKKWKRICLFQDIDRCREVYKTCLEIIPHKKFTFAKIWIMFAHFEVRQKQLTTARKIMVSRQSNSQICIFKVIYHYASIVELTKIIHPIFRSTLCLHRVIKYRRSLSCEWILKTTSWEILHNCKFFEWFEIEVSVAYWRCNNVGSVEASFNGVFVAAPLINSWCNNVENLMGTKMADISVLQLFLQCLYLQLIQFNRFWC